MSYLVKASIHFNVFPIELFIFSSLRVIVPILAGDGANWRKSTSPRGQHHDKPRFHFAQGGRWRTRLEGPCVDEVKNTQDEGKTASFSN